MNRLELAERLARKYGLTKRMSQSILSYILTSIEDEVASGKKVKLSGFGVFDRSQRKKRNGINPNTMEKLVVPGMASVKFSAGTNFKAKVRAKPKAKKA